jgi:hypothetical protein
MQKTLIPTLFISVMSLSFSAHAAGQMKAGLWEMKLKSDLVKNMPKVPPAQLEQMRKMGIEMPTFKDGGMVTKVCISKEMAERNEPPEMNQKESGCQAKNYQRSGNAYSLDIVCDGPLMKGTGKVKGAFNGDQSFTSTYDFTGTAQGQPVKQHHESSGKWLAADCGNVKPMDAHMKKGK